MLDRAATILPPPCPACDGAGRFVVTDLRSGDQTPGEHCADCRGTGGARCTLCGELGATETVDGLAWHSACLAEALRAAPISHEEIATVRPPRAA